MDILEINEEKKFIRCEPLVTVQRLVEALQAKGNFIFLRNLSLHTLTCQIIMQQIYLFSGKKKPTQPF